VREVGQSNSHILRKFHSDLETCKIVASECDFKCREPVPHPPLPRRNSFTGSIRRTEEENEIRAWGVKHPQDHSLKVYQGHRKLNFPYREWETRPEDFAYNYVLESNAREIEKLKKEKEDLIASLKKKESQWEAQCVGLQRRNTGPTHQLKDSLSRPAPAKKKSEQKKYKKRQADLETSNGVPKDPESQLIENNGGEIVKGSDVGEGEDDYTGKESQPVINNIENDNNHRRLDNRVRGRGY
jgi:hypothetical protein